METPFDRLSVLAKYSALSVSRIRFLAEADESVIQQITCGVLFVMAFWSGPSVQAFRKITEVLEALDPVGRLEFVVVDTDGCPELYDQAKFIGRQVGAGETAWIKDGKVLRVSWLGYYPECCEPNTMALLSECSSD